MTILLKFTSKNDYFTKILEEIKYLFFILFGNFNKVTLNKKCF